MTCPICGSNANQVVWTERKAKVDRRRHECACGVRWTSVTTIERGSITGGQTPPVIQVKTPANGTQAGKLFSESSIRSGDSGPNPKASLPPERERARSNEGAEFIRVLKVFCDRWERSNRRPYPVTPADKNQLGRFMRQQGQYIESFAAICDRYLSDRGEFAIRRSANHRLAWLLTNGLAQYGGTPRESAEQYAARIRREHEARKAESRRPSTDSAVRDLIADLANKAAIG